MIYLTSVEVADLIGCTKAMACRYAKLGYIPIAKRVGNSLLFDQNEVSAVIRTWRLQRIPPRAKREKV